MIIHSLILLFSKDIDTGMSWATVLVQDEAALLRTFESHVRYLTTLYGHDNNDDDISYGILGGVGRKYMITNIYFYSFTLLTKYSTDAEAECLLRRANCGIDSVCCNGQVTHAIYSNIMIVQTIMRTISCIVIVS